MWFRRRIVDLHDIDDCILSVGDLEVIVLAEAGRPPTLFGDSCQVVTRIRTREETTMKRIVPVALVLAECSPITEPEPHIRSPGRMPWGHTAS